MLNDPGKEMPPKICLHLDVAFQWEKRFVRVTSSVSADMCLLLELCLHSTCFTYKVLQVETWVCHGFPSFTQCIQLVHGRSGTQGFAVLPWNTTKVLVSLPGL